MSGLQVDGLTPVQVLRPTEKSDVVSHLSEAYRQDKRVVPWGGGTRMEIGNIPTRYDVALDLCGLTSEIDHVAGDMTLVCDAGFKVSEISSILAASQQRLPFEVMNPDEATIGGSLASNAPSRLAPRFGGIRDWVIGMSVVLADGTPTKSGGRVVKNVQGYDLHRLHTGAFGTLGVITSVALKLVPVAEGTQTVAMWFDRLSSAKNAATYIGNINIAVEAARLFSGSRAVGAIRELAADRHMESDSFSSDASYLMLVQVSGSHLALNRQLNELTGLAGTVPATGYEILSGASETDIWTYAGLTEESATLRLRIAAKPTATIDLLNRLERILNRIQAASTSSIVDVGYGTLQFSVESIDDYNAVTFINDAKETVLEIGGSVMVERCPISVKQDIDVFGIEPSSSQIMKNMKQQFDSKKILNPGRFAFRI